MAEGKRFPSQAFKKERTMAYMNQERKALIVAALKAIPEIADWKYSLRVRNSSTIVMNIRQADMDLLEGWRIGGYQAWSNDNANPSVTNAQVNNYYLDRQFEGKRLEVMTKVVAALNLRALGEEGGNWDKSDSMTDYFNVGWYVDVNIGQWDEPFIEALPRTQWTKTAPAQKTPRANVNPLNYQAYLPFDWATLTPGRKAAATKKAMAYAASLLEVA